jgi:hypothetical protein
LLPGNLENRMPSKSSSPARIDTGVVPELAKRIELWPTDRLIPFARNPRTHSDAQVAQIAASIAESGFNNPILVDTKAGIIAGHGRLLAARKLNLTEVPVIVLDHLTETQKRAYLIADNKLALNAGWDDELLSLELAELQAQDFGLDLIGFDNEELEALRAASGLTEGLTDEDSCPEPLEEAASRREDLWVLGDHRVLCGDAASREDVDRLVESGPIDLINTDPPTTFGWSPAPTTPLPPASRRSPAFAITSAWTSIGTAPKRRAPRGRCVPRTGHSKMTS